MRYTSRSYAQVGRELKPSQESLSGIKPIDRGFNGIRYTSERF